MCSRLGRLNAQLCDANPEHDFFILWSKLFLRFPYLA